MISVAFRLSASVALATSGGSAAAISENSGGGDSFWLLFLACPELAERIKQKK